MKKSGLIFMAVVALLTMLTWASVDPLWGMALFFYGPFILGGLLVLSLVFWFISTDVVKFLWLGVLAFVLTTFSMPILGEALTYVAYLNMDSYRIAMDVDTPDGLQRDMETFSMRPKNTFLMRKIQDKEFGDDPIAIDFGERGKLIAHFHRTGIMGTFPRYIYGHRAYESGEMIGKREIPPEYWPTFIIEKNGTRTEILPHEIEEHLGSGYHLRRLWIEMEE